jgi:hypothetical protein
MTLTIGIPSRGINLSLHRVIKHALSLDVEEILIGINPGVEGPGDLSEYRDSRIKVFFHSHDIGLYGNFRFLVKESKTVFFAWLCTDDLLSPEVTSAIKPFVNSQTNLIIPSWAWSEYRPQLDAPFNSGQEVTGTYPNLESSTAIIRSALECEPSWIFGVWRTSYLQKIFPKSNFDWLDTHLLQKALLSRRVSVVKVKTPTLIGTWHWASKIPSAVSQKGHNPALAIWHQLLLTPQILLIRPTAFWQVLLRIRFLITSSRSLNQALRGRGVR